MPRLARERDKDCIYHVFTRGNRRQRVFCDDEDRSWFMDRLLTIEGATGTTHVAHCLMSNHLHLVLGPGPGPCDISRLMQRTLGPYAQWFNRRHGTVGHLFHGRFGSRLIRSEEDLITVVRYVHRNPVEAKLVHRAEDWPWSSHEDHLRRDPPEYLREGAHVLRDALGPDPGAALRRFRALIERTEGPAILLDQSGTHGMAPPFRLQGKGAVAAPRDRPTLRVFAKMVERRFHIPEATLAGRRRDRSVATARRFFCRISIRSLGYEGAAVAEFLGRSPSNVSVLGRACPGSEDRDSQFNPPLTNTKEASPPPQSRSCEYEGDVPASEAERIGAAS